MSSSASISSINNTYDGSNNASSATPLMTQPTLQSISSINTHISITPSISDILHAASQGDFPMVSDAIRHGLISVHPTPSSTNDGDSYDASVLHYACISGNPSLIEYIIESGADVNAVGGRMKSTPLHWAIGANDSDAVHVLMAHGASALHHRDILGYTPYSMSLKHGDLDIAKSMARYLPPLVDMKWLNYALQPTVIVRAKQAYLFLMPFVWVFFIGYMFIHYHEWDIFFLAKGGALGFCLVLGALHAWISNPFHNTFHAAPVYVFCFYFGREFIFGLTYIAPIWRVNGILMILTVFTNMWWLKCAGSGYIRGGNASSACNRVASDCSSSVDNNYNTDDSEQQHRICQPCRLYKPLRSKHCSLCRRCIARFDHHCLFLNACIGAHNHKRFISTLAIGAGSCSYTLVLLLLQLNAACPVKSGTSWYANLELWRHCDPWTSWMAFLALVNVILEGSLLFWHLYLAAFNCTTNEWFNSRRYAYCSRLHLPKWWKCQVARQLLWHQSTSNAFDRGVVANLAEFFNTTVLGVPPPRNLDYTDANSVMNHIKY